MADRDVETIRSRAKFVATLRRVADAVEQKIPVRIQVASKRFLVPADAILSVEHEVEGADEELELQLKWKHVEGDAGAPEPVKAGSAKGTRKPLKRKARKSGGKR
jgi:amphi-Trp domain-containing protein